MSTFGDPPEDWFGRILRYCGYFLFGALLGMLPAGFLVAAVSAPHIAWEVPIYIVVCSGLISCLVGILTHGRFLGWLLRLFGTNIDQ